MNFYGLVMKKISVLMLLLFIGNHSIAQTKDSIISSL